MKTIGSQELKKLKSEDSGLQVIDVREPVEYQAEHLPGSRSCPLSAIDKNIVDLNKERPVYLLCRTGSRASEAARKLEKQGFEDVTVIEAGLEGLKASGFETVRGQSRVWALDRQVRFAAGSLILIGLLGFWFIAPGFLFLSAFVACGLIFSAVTNTCGMALLLARCPWNQAAH